jgi:hypothetical protein
MIESGCKEGTRVQKCPTESSQHAALTFLNARRDVLVDARQCGNPFAPPEKNNREVLPPVFNEEFS